MIRVGITGGIGSGKTTVCEVFKLLGVPVFFADQEARNLQDHDLELKKELIALFGNEIYLPQGTLNRMKLAGVIFNDKQALKKVNAIIHPRVRERLNTWSSQYQAQPYVLYEAAVLFESGTYKDCDLNIIVVADKQLRLTRVIKRDGLKECDILSRMNNQLTDEQKIPLADFVIYNDQQRLIIPQVLDIDKIIKEHGKVW